jgi:ribonuclease D
VISAEDSSPPAPDLTSQPEPHARVTAIASVADYLSAVEAIGAGNGPIAIDAERASGFRYSQRAYLIQIFRRGSGIFLFDPPAIGRFTELNDVIKDEEWVLHAASQDLDCLREVGLIPTKIFDTELAARLVGLPRVGLGTVVEELLGIHLAKEHSAADWSTRPLPQSWLVYAALDVELLVDLRDEMERLLRETGKTAIAEQEFEAELHSPLKEPVAEPWRRLSGVHSIRDPRKLAIARELWLARNRYAQEIDTAPGRLIPDTSLVAAATAVLNTKHDLATFPEFNGRASRSQLDRWWTAIEVGKATDDLPTLRAPGESIPAPRTWADRNPDADKRLRTVRAAIAEISMELNIPVENLLKPGLLRQLAWKPPEPGDLDSITTTLVRIGARPWQIDATAQRILEAFVEAHQSDEEPGQAAS